MPRGQKRPAPTPVSQTAESLACRRCRARKVKCDGQYPACGRCEKVNAPCIVADDSASRTYTRAQVYGLEERVKRLESLLGQNEAEPRVAAPGTRMPGSQGLRDSHSGNRYLRSASGARFLWHMLNAIRQHAISVDFESLLSRRTPGPPVYYHEPHRLPPREEICLAVQEYFDAFHVQHPFLDAAAVWATVAHVDEYRNVSPVSLTDSHRHGLFQLNMVMSIGTVRPFRRGEISLHPFGFFTAALQVIAPRGFCFNRLENIENFLLIARFGVYFYIGCSIWEISRICMRICIELNLHRNSPPVAADQDRRAIIFWESYSLDRFASAMLGRPFGIEDQDIEISTPRTTPSLQSSHRTFSHMVELALISSQMHRALHQETHAPQTNEDALLHSSRSGAAIYTTLATFHQKLAHWRSAAPIQEGGSGSLPACVFHMPEYFELRYQEERLTLIRAVIEASRRRGPPGSSRLHDGGGPGGGGLFPSGILQSSCLEAAVGVICAYDVLQRRGVIMYSRYYMHVLFSAGILIILVVFLRIDIKGRGPTTLNPSSSNSDGGCRSCPDAGFTTRYSSNVVDLSDWLSQSVAPGSERPQDISLDRALEVLTTVGDLLSWLAEQMPDSALYSRVFNALRQNMERMVHHHHQHHQSLRKGQSIPVPVAVAVPNEPTFPLPAQSTADPPGKSSNMADFNLNLGLDYSPSVGTEPSLTELLGELFPDIPVDMLGDMGVRGSPGGQDVWPLSDFPFMPPGFMENH